MKGKPGIVSPTLRLQNSLFCCFHKVIFKKWPPTLWDCLCYHLLFIWTFSLFLYCSILLSLDPTSSSFPQWEDLFCKGTLVCLLQDFIRPRLLQHHQIESLPSPPFTHLWIRSPQNVKGVKYLEMKRNLTLGDEHTQCNICMTYC